MGTVWLAIVTYIGVRSSPLDETAPRDDPDQPDVLCIMVTGDFFLPSRRHALLQMIRTGGRRDGFPAVVSCATIYLMIGIFLDGHLCRTRTENRNQHLTIPHKRRYEIFLVRQLLLEIDADITDPKEGVSRKTKIRQIQNDKSGWTNGE